MKSRISLLIIITVFSLSICWNFQSPADAAPDKHLIAPVVVEINSVPIYETELLYFLIGRYGQQVLAELIENAILAQIADEYEVSIDPGLPREEMLKKYGEEKFNELSEAFDVKKILNAVRRERLAEKVYDELVLGIIEEKGFEVTQEEALDYYLGNSGQWSRPAVARFSIIVLDTTGDAKSAYDELKDGVSFVDVAKKYSVDEATKDNGGDVGNFVKRGYFRGPLKKIEDAAFKIPIDSYSEIISIENKYFIVMPKRRLPRVEKKFNEVRDYIVDILILERAEPFVTGKLAKLRDSSKIEIIYPIFDTDDEGDTTFVKATNLPKPTTKCLVYPTVVKVNDERIDEQEMLFFLIGRHGQSVLQELVENSAISQQGASLGVSVDKDEPDNILNKTYSAEKISTLENAFNMDHVKDAIHREILAKKVFIIKKEQLMVENGLEVTESDARTYYDKNEKMWEVPERVQFSIIVTDTEPAMDAALDEMRAGESFANVATKYSVDEVTNKNGGDIGTLWPRGLFFGPFTELEDEIFKLQIDEISDPIFIQDRFYVVKLSEKIPGEIQAFDDVKAEIMEQMVATIVYPKLQEWLTKLGNKIKIDMKYPIFEMETDLTMKAKDKLNLE